MKTKVILTIDTEPSIAGAFDDPTLNPLLHEPVWGKTGGKSHALGFLIDTLRQNDLAATFFVETVHTNFFPPSEMGHYADLLCQAGQDVQLHLHPAWQAFGEVAPRPNQLIHDHCSQLNINELAALISQGREIIEKWTGKSPNSMRTGNFSTSASVYEAMERAEMFLSSNICTGVLPPLEQHLFFPNGVAEIGMIKELPVTCFEDRGPVGRGKLRPLQVTACSFAEMHHILTECHQAKLPYVVIATHPFEFLKKKDFRYRGLRPNSLVQARFKKLCRFLANNNDRFTTTTFGELDQNSDLAPASARLIGRPHLSVGRAIANVTNDRLLYAH